MSDINIQAMIETGIPGAIAKVSGDGCNASVIVISDAFEGLSLLKQQKLVYGTLGDNITNGTIHALTIKSYTPEQWETLQNKG